MTKKILCAVIAVVMMLAIMPIAALGDAVAERSALSLLDKAWAEIDQVEAEALSMKATPEKVTLAAYEAAAENELVTDLVWEGERQFAFKVDGMHCVYVYRLRNEITPYEGEYKEDVTFIPAATKNGPSSANVLLIAPYYGHDSSFTDQYKNEAQSIASATGGSYTLIQSTNATGPAIASAMPGKGVVIFDSHGVQSGTSSYLCLTTNSGITSSDYSNGYAVSSGSEAFIDGRYINVHKSAELSNCIVWMAICEGMKKAGKGTTGTALLQAGAGIVYGYSQSVTFAGDYLYEETFWTQMKNGATVAEAVKVMKNTHGIPDPYGDAYPIVMSPTDSFPSNPDGAQTVTSDWELFGSSEPEAITSVSITPTSATTVVGGKTTFALSVQPANVDYTATWSSANTGIATIDSTGKATGVSAGSTTITCVIRDNVANKSYTRTASLTVNNFEGYMIADEIEAGGTYIIVAGGQGVAVSNNIVSSNHYLAPVSVTENSDSTLTVSSSVNVNEISWVAGGNATSGWTFKSVDDGKYMGLDSTEYLAPSTTAVAWLYSGNDLNNQIDSEGYYYLSYASENTRFTTSKQTGNNIVLYEYVTTEDDPTPTTQPTVAPTVEPTVEPTVAPTVAPTAAPGETMILWSENFDDTENISASIVDYDGDASNWYLTSDFYHTENYAAGSDSYKSNTVYTPDNWLLSPTFTIPANGTDYELTYYVRTRNASYPAEHYAVMLATETVYNGDDTVNLGAFTETLKEETLTASDTTWRQVTIDLSAYAGQTVTIAWRHYDCTDQYAMYIDTINCEYTANGGVVEPTTYTVTFKDWDGTVLSTQTVEEGAAATAPAAPSRTGYTFTGWDVDFSNVTSDLTVTAQYSVNSYTITYYVDGALYNTQTYAYGAAVTMLAEPTKEGYTFSGWDTTITTMPANNVTVNGTFSVNSYTITYYVDGALYNTQTYAYGAAVTMLAEPTKEGYTFSGWDTTITTMPANNVVVNGTFTLIPVTTYTVTFMANGEVVSTQNVQAGAAATAPAAPEVAGYHFVEWDTDYSNVQSDLVVTAVYTKGLTVMTPGAQVRTSPTKGIRFATTVARDYDVNYIDITSFGTLLMPTAMLGENELTLETANVQNIESLGFSSSSTEERYVYFGSLLGLADSMLSLEITARGYVYYTFGGEQFLAYAQTTVSRSYNGLLGA